MLYINLITNNFPSDLHEFSIFTDVMNQLSDIFPLVVININYLLSLLFSLGWIIGTTSNLINLLIGIRTFIMTWHLSEFTLHMG